MRTVMLKGLLAHKRRMFGTFLAVFLGVAFLSGTLVLGDTLRGNFDNLFTEANAGTDAVVRHASKLGTDPGEAKSQRGLIDTTLVDKVRNVDGVDHAVEPLPVRLLARQSRRQRDVLERGEGGDQVVRLEHEADAIPAQERQLLVRQRAERHVADEDLA